MSYQVKFTDTTKLSITVQDQMLETTQTSLSFVGKNYAGYSQPIAENFLHLLENFANSSAPSHPVQGQLWFDSTAGISQLKVNLDGSTTGWVSASGIKKSATAPSAGNVIGDVWIDTAKSQLNLYNGSSWLLVGPQYSEGSRSGPEVETIIGVDDVSYFVIVFYCNNYRVAILSNQTFIPKSSIPGFAKINQGITLSTFDFSNSGSSNLTKFWGRTSESDALNVNGTTVSSTYFLRSDISSTTNKQFNVRDDAGINIGSNLNFNISTTSNETLLVSKTSGKNVKIKLTSSSILPGSESQALLYTAINLDASGKIGFGVDNMTPLATIDVKGVTGSTDLGIRADGRLVIDNLSDSTSITTGSIVTSGGLAVRLKSNFGGNIEVNGVITVGNTNQVAGAVLLPGPSSVSDTLVHKIYDIGTETRAFRKIYADTIYGNIVGSVTVNNGLINGSITGSASSLSNPTNFSITGDVVTTTSVSFNGSQNTIQLNTQISDTYYTNAPATTTFQANDVLFLNRVGDTKLKQISKNNFVNSMPVVPVGAIFPFAGSAVPNGYLLCDGSEIPIGTYIALYNVIGFTYKSASLLQGRSTFALPDLRGRFPLGRDNMNNGITVPSKASSEENPVYITTISGTASRVSSATASVIGGEYPSALTASEQGGIDTRKIYTENLPSHRHTLKSSDGTRYYAVNPNGNVQPPELGGYVGKVHAIGENAQFIPVTGDIDTTISQLQQPFNIMNPYLTINYIIFTGLLS